MLRKSFIINSKAGRKEARTRDRYDRFCTSIIRNDVLQLIQRLGYSPKASSLTKSSVAAFYKANQAKLNCANDVGAIADRIQMLYKPAPGSEGTRVHVWVSNKRNMAYRGRGKMMQVRTIAHRFKTTEEVDAIARTRLGARMAATSEATEAAQQGRSETPTRGVTELLAGYEEQFANDRNTDDEISDDEDENAEEDDQDAEENDEEDDGENEETDEDEGDAFEFNEDDDW